jgi:hypothetical protein
VNNAVLGDPVRIEVTPSTGTIQQGDSIAFVAIGYDINGNQVNLRSPSWTSNNGEINNFGFYSAWNSVPGPLVVRVTQNGAIGEANITINPW